MPASEERTRRDIVVIGASAGGLSAILKIAESLPSVFPAAIFITLHIGAYDSVLHELVGARRPSLAARAIDGEAIRAGRIYVAPPNRHLLLDGDRVRLSAGPKEHHSRPAIDPLFRSAALAFGPRVIGVLLSGRLDDGTAGLQAIKEYGGLAIVQDPNEADEPSMPLSAIKNVAVDHRLKVAEIGPTLTELVGETAVEEFAGDPTSRRKIVKEHEVATERGSPMKLLEDIGTPSKFTCPECDGVLFEIVETKPKRFRCHTGHAYSLWSLSEAQSTYAEEVVWSAVRTLQEHSELLRELAAEGDSSDSARLLAAAEIATAHANNLRQLTAASEDAKRPDE